MSVSDQLKQYKRAITTSELAALLAVNRVTIHRLVRAGRIPHYRVANCVRFDPSAIAQWLTERTTL